jgi:hypothetical protein
MEFACILTISAVCIQRGARCAACLYQSALPAAGSGRGMSLISLLSCGCAAPQDVWEQNLRVWLSTAATAWFYWHASDPIAVLSLPRLPPVCSVHQVVTCKIVVTLFSRYSAAADHAQTSCKKVDAMYLKWNVKHCC